MSRLAAMACGLVMAVSLGGCAQTGVGCDLVIAGVPGETPPEAGTALDPAWPILAAPSEFEPLAGLGTDESGSPLIHLTLQAPAAQRLAAFTDANVGSFLAVAVDGTVAVAPMVMAPISDGLLDVTLVPNDPSIERFASCT
jgi:hypothetical protein